MNIKITFKNMESSDALKSYAEKKVGEKIEKYVFKPAMLELTLSVERHNNSVHLNFKAGKTHLEASDVANDMYVAIDNVADKLEHQLRKHKGKMRDHSKSVSTRELSDTLGTTFDS